MKCSYCAHLQNRGPGMWKVGNADAAISGYHISKLMKLNSPIYELWDECSKASGNDYKTQVFYNKKLGLPYAGTGSKLTADMLDKCTFDYLAKLSSTKDTCAGLDVGSKFDMQIVISAHNEGRRKRLVLNALRLNSMDEVKAAIDTYNIKTMCVGIKPERNLVKSFREEMYGKCDIIMVEELEGRSGALKIHGYRDSEDEGVVTVDRTWMLDETMKQVRHKNIIVPKNFRSIIDGFWIKSMESITRIFENEKEEYRWSKAVDDHFRFADAFSMLAWMRCQDVVIIGDDFRAPQEPRQRSGLSEAESKSQCRADSVGIIRRRYGINRHGFSRRQEFP
jgi:hypothetical protein